MISLFIDFVRFCASAVNEFLDKNGPYMSAAISFYGLFSMFPLLLALISVLGFLLGSGDLQQRLITEIPKQVPVGEGIIEPFLQRIAEGRAVNSILASFGLFWASTAVFGAIRKSINAIWGIRKTRPFLQERLMDFALMFGASLMLLLSIFTTTLLRFFQEFFDLFLPHGAPTGDELWSKIALGIPPVTIFVTFLIMYTWLPNTLVKLRDAWLPAVLASAAFNIATVVFLQWLAAFPAYQNVYGAVSAVIALLAWVYVSSIIMLSGALVTSRYAAYQAARDELKRLDHLSRNLERVRARPVALATADAPTT